VGSIIMPRAPRASEWDGILAVHHWFTRDKVSARPIHTHLAAEGRQQED